MVGIITINLNSASYARLSGHIVGQLMKLLFGTLQRWAHFPFFVK